MILTIDLKKQTESSQVLTQLLERISFLNVEEINYTFNVYLTDLDNEVKVKFKASTDFKFKNELTFSETFVWAEQHPSIKNFFDKCSEILAELIKLLVILKDEENPVVSMPSEIWTTFPIDYNNGVFYLKDILDLLPFKDSDLVNLFTETADEIKKIS